MPKTYEAPNGGQVRFRVLGPPEVRADCGVLQLGGSKQRTLLAALLIHANRVVSVDRLIDAIWDQVPPATVGAQVQARISSLRAMLAGAGARGAVVTQPPGYLLRVEPHQLDLHVFEESTRRARRALAEGRAAAAAEGFAAALGLWRGPALGGLEGQYARAEAERLEERRVAALEGRVEAELALGRHAELVGELMPLVADHPLRERLRAQLMVCLYRDGRQAEALAVYREGRRRLVDELGLEPGEELRRIERAIVTADPCLESTPTVVSRARRPSLLPADVADFTGRREHVAILGDLLAAPDPDGGRRGTAVTIAAIVGKPGAGKTTLAVHVAHELHEAFPDGCLYANLRGFDARPVEPAGVLRRFLRALEVDDGAIPQGEDERAELYRIRLAERRVLVVLDNAAGASQAWPLLPGAAGCAVLVTSRVRPIGLEGARVVALDTLQPEEAVELLSRLAGRRRVEAEPEAAEAIAGACGHLPLAVRVAGARLAGRPHWRLARLAERLADERRRLDELVLDQLDVRASFAPSYAGLDPEQKRAFHRLALLDAPDFAGGVAAALLDVPPSRAERTIEALVDAHLLEVSDGDGGGDRARYRFHDLLRDYARERGIAEEAAGRDA